MGWFGGAKPAAAASHRSNGASNGAARAAASAPAVTREDKAKVDAAGGVPDMTALEN